MAECGFGTRKAIADAFSTAVETEFRRLGFTVAINGAEHTHPAFVGNLHRSTDQTSLAIRFAPDGIASVGDVPRSFYWEAKAGMSVERTAWEQYQKLVNNGNVVIVIFGSATVPATAWRWGLVQEIRLIPADVTVERFAPHLRFPIRDGWITPRGSIRWEDVRNGKPQASGTPYREVDSTSLCEWRVLAARAERIRTIRDVWLPIAKAHK
jgi:hypothetical protein